MDEKKQILSSFLDGEVSDAEVKRIASALGQEEDLQATWERYNLISDALQQRLPPQLPRAIAKHVREQVEDSSATD